MNGLLAKHDDHEGDSKGEDPVDKNQKLGVRETAGMAHRINVVLEGEQLLLSRQLSGHSDKDWQVSAIHKLWNLCYI